MGLFGSSKEKTNTKGASSKKAVEAEKVTETVLNINKYNYFKDAIGRRIQLTAFFHMLKIDMGDQVCAEMSVGDDHFYIPFSFNLYEEICIAKTYMVDNWYVDVELAEGNVNLVEIFFDEVKIKGNPEFIQYVTKVFLEAISFTSDFSILQWDFTNCAAWQWEKFKKLEYQKCIEAGDSIFLNGSITVYPFDESEIIIYNETDFKTTSISNMEYIVMRSNVKDKSDMVILIDNTRKKILGTGFDPFEETELNEIFNPSSIISDL